VALVGLTLGSACCQACHKEFNGGAASGGASLPPTLAFYDRPPPSRLGAFEVVLSLSDPAGGIQHVLLHTKLGSARFPSVNSRAPFAPTVYLS
jgi:hypothetical protein